jgi:carboxypeptidase family protein
MSRISTRSLSLLIAFCMALVSTPVYLAQTVVTGAVQGRVLNFETKAPIPGAIVTAKNLQIGVEATARAREDGSYFISNLPQGSYKLTAQADGFEEVPNAQPPVSFVSELSIVIKQATTLNAPPIALRAKGSQGPAASGVSIKEGSLERLVNTDSATRGGSFGSRELLSLPLPGVRTFDDLAFLLPGVAPPPKAIGHNVGPGVGPGVGTSGQFSVNGLPSRYNNFTIDGSDNNDEDIGVRRQGFVSLVPQSIESLREYNVTTLLAEPQFGRNMGAQADAVSRSGGNDYHGTLYGFFTGRPLQAEDAFETGFNPAAERKNFRGQYGFVLGGPFVKEKTLFFTSFEQQTIRASKEFHFAVPTSGQRSFRESRGVTERGESWFSLFPLPNNGGGPFGANTFTDILSADGDGSIFSIKLDQRIGKRHTLTGRYNFTDDDRILPVTGEALFSSVDAKVRTQNLSLFLVTSLSSRASNVARVSYGRTRLEFDEVRGNPFLIATSFQMPEQDKRFLLNAPLRDTQGNVISGRNTERGSNNDPGAASDGTGLLGQINLAGYSPVGVDVYHFPQKRANNIFQYADTLSYIAGSHRLTAGFDVRRVQLNSLLARSFRPLGVFNGAIDLARGGSSFFLGRDFMSLGAPTTMIQTQAVVPDNTIGLRYWANSFFFSDQFRLRPGFTLTYGVRYELNTVPSEVNNRIEDGLNSPAVDKFIQQEKAFNKMVSGNEVSGLELFLDGRKEIFRRDDNNIGPYIAFAWDPTRDGKMAVRGGYGIYYAQIPGAVISQSRSLYPFFVGINCPGILNGAMPSLTYTNPSVLRAPNTLNQFIQGVDDPSGLVAAISSPATTRGAAGTAFVLPAANLETPYAQHWGLTIDRELKGDFLFSIAYVGTRGVHLLRLTTPNYGPNAIPVMQLVEGSAEEIVRRNDVNFQIAPGRIDARSLASIVGRRAFPLLGAFTLIESDGNSIYNGLQLQVNKRLARGIQFTTAYTWSHAIDDSSDIFALSGATAVPQNSFNRKGERGDASFDVRHRFVTSWVWDLPFFEQNKILGGWQLAGIGTFQTGQPFTVLTGLDSNLDGNLTDRLGSTAGITEVNKGSLRFQFPSTPAAQFSLVAARVDGAVGRNTFRAPGIATVDLAVNKNFKLSERQKLEVRSEFFNLFNRTHFGIPVHQLFFPGLGQSVDTLIPARAVQFGVKYIF